MLGSSIQVPGLWLESGHDRKCGVFWGGYIYLNKVECRI